MKTPVSQLDDLDMRAVPNALLRAAESARRLAEQTGTPFVIRQPVAPDKEFERRETDRALPEPTGTTK